MKFYIILFSLISFSGYCQTYKIPLNGKSLTVKTCSGRVYDNGGTSKVIPNSDGSITILPAEQGKIIKLELDTLDKYQYDSLLIYQGSSINKLSLIGMPFAVYGQSYIYYGSEKDGAITLVYKSLENPWEIRGFSGSITCINKLTTFDFTADHINVFKSTSENHIMFSVHMPAQKEKAPTFKMNIYYSKDTVLDKSDVMGEPIFASALSTSQLSLNGNPKTPSEVKAGDYYIIIQFDPDNFITETNEENNIIVSELYTIK